VSASPRKELERLMADYLAGALDDGGQRHLHALLLKHPEAAQELAALSELDSLLRSGAVSGRQDAELLMRQIEARTESDPALVDKIIGRAAAQSGEDLDALAETVGTVAPADREPLRGPAAWFGSKRSAYAFAASMLLSATVIFSMLVYMQRLWDRPAGPSGPRAQPTLARLADLHDAVWAAGERRAAGQALHAGTLRLESGVVRIDFDAGAVVILEGPAALDLRTSASAHLLRGRLTARAEGGARGFRITSPGMRVVDLGTEFAVDRSLEDSAEVHVFDGLVEAVLIDERGEAVAARALGENRAVRIDLASRTFRDVPAEGNRFVRVRTERVPLELAATGAGLEGGAVDTRWTVSEMSRAGPSRAARPAVVLQALPAPYRPNDGASRWLSTSAAPAEVPGRSTHRFETRFELAQDLAPSTAVLRGRYVVDDQLLQIRINGQPVPVPPRNSADMRLKHREWIDFEIHSGFAAGTNVLSFDVYNETVSQMGLRVELSGEARRRLSLNGSISGASP